MSASFPEWEIAADRRNCVSARSLAKSGRVLYSFVHFYLPCYGKDDKFLVRNYGVFAWASAFIYDVDEQIEAGEPVPDALSRLDLLAGYLGQRFPLDPQILRLLEDGRRYYRFEHGATRGRAGYTLAELEAAMRLRSFDLRLLHRCLARLAGEPYREELFAWFRAFETCMETEDDLSSLAEDLRRGTFNIFSLAERLAPGEGLTFAARLRRQVAAEMERCAATLSPEDRRRCEEALAFYWEVCPRQELPAALPGVLAPNSASPALHLP